MNKKLICATPIAIAAALSLYACGGSEIGDPDITAIKNVNLSIGESEFVTLLGPSGCGKSTLLDIIAGLEPPSGGAVLLEGHPITGPSPKMGMVFQPMSLFPWRTALANVELGLPVTTFKILSPQCKPLLAQR